MKFFDGLKLALSNLLRTKFRTFLTTLGVVIGISAIVLFVSLGLGLQEITANQIASIDALTTLTVTQTPETASMEAGQPITESSVSRIKEIAGVDKVSESVSIPVNAVFGKTNSGAIVYGIKKDNAVIEIGTLKSGSFVSSNDEAVISAALANSFSVDPPSLLGQNITLKLLMNSGTAEFKSVDLPLKVVGIDTNDTTNLVFASYDKIYSIGQFDKISAVKVKAKSRKDVDTIKKEVEKMAFTVTTIKDLIDQIDKIFLLAQIILALIGSIGLLVSSLGIINTMTISLLERTHEIGIMKAIGASNHDIRRLYYLESGLIGFAGGAMGILIAVLIGKFFNYIFNLFASVSGQHYSLFVTPVKFSLAVVVFAVLVSLASGVYPAFRAKRLSPMDALRQ